MLLPNPATRFPLTCGASPERLGLRVPALDDRLAKLADVTVPILQSSANPSGESDPNSLEDVDPRIRRGADIELDAGVLAGTPSTVVDLSSYEDTGEYDVLREGAVSVPDTENVKLPLIGPLRLPSMRLNPTLRHRLPMSSELKDSEPVYF